jgi:hypothetical protein
VKYIKSHLTSIIICFLLGCILAAGSIQHLTPLVFSGKEFASRSFITRAILSTISVLGFSTLLFLIYTFGRNTVYPSRFYKKGSEYIQSLLRSLNSIKLIHWIGWIGTGIVGLTLLGVHLRLVFFPYQMEYREGAIILTTQAFLKGINPWALQNNLTYINVYGFVYNLIVLPFAWLLGNQLWIHRLISFAAIVGQLWIIALVMRKKGIGWLWIALAGLFVWLGQIYFTTPLARPDALGQLFFLLTLFIPLLYNFSPRSILLSAAFGVLGFYTKPYFVLGLPLIATYVFLFISKKKALWYAGSSLLVLAVSAILVNKIFEAYFLNVVFSHIADTNSIFSYMVGQFIKFARDYWALLFIGLIAIIRILSSQSNYWKNLKISFLPIQDPFFSQCPDFNLFTLIITTALIYFSLGRHNGTYQDYYYQLLTPFLVILIFGYLQKMPELRGLAILLITLNLFTHGYENLKPDLQPYDVTAWKRVAPYLVENKVILNSPVVTTMMAQKGLAIENSGQTPYYFPYPAYSSYFYPNLERIAALGDQYLSDRNRKSESQAYDFIFEDASYRDYFHKSDIHQKYKIIDTINFIMPHVFQDWEVNIMIPDVSGNAQ